MIEEISIVFVVVGRGTSKIEVLGTFVHDTTANVVAEEFRELYSEVNVEPWVLDYTDIRMEVTAMTSYCRKLVKSDLYAKGDEVAFKDGVIRGFGEVVGEIDRQGNKIYKVKCAPGKLFDEANKFLYKEETTVTVYQDEIIGAAK